MLEILRHNLGNLTRFSGRTGPKAFWLYVAMVLIAYMAVLMIAMTASIHAKAFDPSLFMGVNAAGGLISILLLAASVTRRLHDSDRRGWWGLMPLPFLAGGLIGMALMFSGSGDDLESRLMPLVLNNMIYLGLLGVLVVLLCRRGTPGPNRFGDRPS